MWYVDPLVPRFLRVLLGAALALAAVGSASASPCQNPDTSRLYLERDLDGLTLLSKSQSKKSPLEQLQLAYLIVLTALAEENEKTAAEFLQRGLKLFKTNTMKSVGSYAIGSLLYGQQLRMKPYLGIFIGRKPRDLLDQALKLDAADALVTYAQASFFHHTPSSFGGSLDSAATHYQAALQQLDQKPSAACWLKPSSQAQLIRAYQSMGKTADAEALLVAGRKDYPNNRWLPGDEEGS